jgi:hypothetical protein
MISWHFVQKTVISGKKWHFPKFKVVVIQKIFDQREQKIAFERETSGAYADNISFLFGVDRF